MPTSPPPFSRITLFIPELLWPEPEDHDVLEGAGGQALATLLSRGRLSIRPRDSMEAVLIQLFGHPENTPYSALRRLGETTMVPENDDACWISADPVHLKFHHDRLVLADASTLKIHHDEAQTLAADLNLYFTDIGRFHAATPERWYLQLASEASLGAITAPPLSAVAGRDVGPLLLDTLPDRASRKLVTEIQTFLRMHSVNQQREKKGLLPINSLWLWSAGRLPPRTKAEFDGVWSTHPLALGLARAAEMPTHPLPDNAYNFLDQASSTSNPLILLEDLSYSVYYENNEAYRSTLKTLENDWFVPLQDALAAGRIKQLHLKTTTAYGVLTWECRRRDLWRLWCRRLPLKEIVKNIEKQHHHDPV